ncbi:MAG TPA: hypothetical protein ENK57_01605 [Polyangiaceae bacterium]|nr:hypothetical protein [Polyangiaceae bacterium]
MSYPATNLAQLLRIRDHNHGFIQGIPGGMGSALGLSPQGEPAILVFVGNKVAAKWVDPSHLVPEEMSTPDGLVCPVSVVEGTSAPDIRIRGRLGDGRDVELSLAQLREQTPLDAARYRLRSYLRGWSGRLLPGSQLARGRPGEGLREGTLTCLIRDRRGGALGLLTNEHVAGAPGSSLYHPSPNDRLIGRTRRVVNTVTDEARFPGYADQPRSYYSVDAAFVELDGGLSTDDLDARMPCLRDDGEIVLRTLEEPFVLSLEDMEPIGRAVVSVGRTRSFQRGMIAGLAYRWVMEGGRYFFTDYLVVGEAGSVFSAPGDSGKLIAIDTGDHLVPLALLWGGWHGQLNLAADYQSKWSYATDFATALAHLDCELVRG